MLAHWNMWKNSGSAYLCWVYASGNMVTWSRDVRGTTYMAHWFPINMGVTSFKRSRAHNRGTLCTFAFFLHNDKFPLPQRLQSARVSGDFSQPAVLLGLASQLKWYLQKECVHRTFLWGHGHRKFLFFKVFGGDDRKCIQGLPPMQDQEEVEA